MAITTDTRLLRLLHLSSATLPVGAYAFSGGMEAAIECGWLSSDKDVNLWLQDQLRFGMGFTDLPILLRLFNAMDQQDIDALQYWNDYLLSCRETREFRLGELALGEALLRLLPELGIPVLPIKSPCYLPAFCQAARHWQLDFDYAAPGYLWSWLDNQVMSATKLLPMGQTRAQIMLDSLQVDVPAIIEQAQLLDDSEIGAGQPALAIASMQHETQYSRLFRS